MVCSLAGLIKPSALNPSGKIHPERKQPAPFMKGGNPAAPVLHRVAGAVTDGLPDASPQCLDGGLYRRLWNFTVSCARFALVGYHHRSGIEVIGLSPCPEGKSICLEWGIWQIWWGRISEYIRNY
jgi:hypothetical protein